MDPELLVSEVKRRTCLLLLAAACLLAAGFAAAVRSGAFLPGWISWEAGAITGGAPEEPEAIVLEDRGLRVLSGGETAWETAPGIRVQSFLWCDIDRDGAKELLLLCWRRGYYGESRPFWVEENDEGWSQHIFIYAWDGETMVPRWMASDLGREVVSWRFHPVQRLVLTDREGAVTAWDWRTWGLTNIPLAEEVSFAAVGDNLIHRQIYSYAFRHWDGDFSPLYEDLAAALRAYDVTAIQQEGLFVEAPEEYASYPLIGTPIQVGEALAEAGFDLVSCAGNHALDFGAAAIDRTAAFFAGRDILTPGIQPTTEESFVPYVLLEEQGIRWAFLGFTASTNGHRLPEDTPYVLHTLDDEGQVRLALEEAREAADLVVVFAHWGTEYAPEPDGDQRRWAQNFADWGADVVVGTHPHVLQPWEWVTGKNGNETLVYYSLGNCVSAQTDPACRIGGLAWFTAAKAGGQCAIVDAGLRTVETTEENGRYGIIVSDVEQDK